MLLSFFTKVQFIFSVGNGFPIFLDDIFDPILPQRSQFFASTFFAVSNEVEIKIRETNFQVFVSLMNKKFRGLISFKYLFDLSSTDLAYQALLEMFWVQFWVTALGHVLSLSSSTYIMLIHKLCIFYNHVSKSNFNEMATRLFFVSILQLYCDVISTWLIHHSDQICFSQLIVTSSGQNFRSDFKGKSWTTLMTKYSLTLLVKVSFDTLLGNWRKL